MRGYGLTRNIGLMSPDAADIREHALKSSCGKFPEKCGVYKSYTRSSKSKRATRTLIKKRERLRARRDIENFDD